jgi:hypothetical protein
VIHGVVVDIEGTTTSLAFVKDVLFPYSRARLADFVREHAADPELMAQLDRLRAETGTESTDAAVTTLLRYIDEDRKHPVLKDLQGRIWREGYRTGAFVAHLYPDVAPALRRWKRAGILLHVFSSGSVEAGSRLRQPGNGLRVELQREIRLARHPYLIHLKEIGACRRTDEAEQRAQDAVLVQAGYFVQGPANLMD